MKTSAYPQIYSVNPLSYLYIAEYVNGEYTSKKIYHKDFVGNISNTEIQKISVTESFVANGDTFHVSAANTYFESLAVNNFVVNSNNIQITVKYTPPSSNVFEAYSEGKVYYDNDYLYVKISNTEIKRVALTSF